MKEIATLLLKLFGFGLLPPCLIGFVHSVATNQPVHIKGFGCLGGPVLLTMLFLYGYIRGYRQALAYHSIIEPPDDFVVSF